MIHQLFCRPEPQTTQHQTTEPRTIQPRTTEPRRPNLGWLNLKRLNLERLNLERPNLERQYIEKDPNSKDWTFNTTESRKITWIFTYINPLQNQLFNYDYKVILTKTLYIKNFTVVFIWWPNLRSMLYYCTIIYLKNFSYMYFEIFWTLLCMWNNHDVIIWNSAIIVIFILQKKFSNYIKMDTIQKSSKKFRGRPIRGSDS